MSSVKPSNQQDTYNSVAAKYAEKLVQFRMQVRKETPKVERPPEDMFPDFNKTGLGVHLEYTRMGEQAVSDKLQERANKYGIIFEHIGLTLGTVLHNIDLKKTMSSELTQIVRDTLLERKVIFFRDQNLSEDEQVSFSRSFGELDAFPFGKPGTNPYILEIIHGKESPGTENLWHSDVTWMEKPSLGSVAQCVLVPPFGGDTLFADSYACYQGLPKDMQEKLQHIHGINDYQVFLMGRGEGELPMDIVEGLKKEIPFGVSHPLLRTHPETGRTTLYLHGGFLRHDSLYDIRTNETLPEKESREIIAFLQKQHGRAEYECRFKWETGSIAFWDNRAVQHYAASDYYPHSRVLRRVTVSGDKPYFDPDV
ncbi:MAG: taurine dioxygenase [Candidatus Azotimanducaceae bacterium]|jgi:taurine dioxygenase